MKKAFRFISMDGDVIIDIIELYHPFKKDGSFIAAVRKFYVNAANNNLKVIMDYAL